MKNSLTIILSVLILVASQPVLVSFISFKSNQNFISKNYCIQKDQVINTCAGKCILGEKIIEIYQNEEHQNTTSFELIDFQVNLILQKIEPLSSISLTPNIITSQVKSVLSNFSNSLFRPPRS